MVRIVVDQSYNTHLETSVLSCSDQYCSHSTHRDYWDDIVQTNDCLLIEDNYFDTIITQINWHAHEPCTVTHLKTLINRELIRNKSIHHITTEIMTFLISETYVEHKTVSSPFGHTGNISCKVQLILLKTKLLPKHIIRQCQQGLIHIIPKSLYTIEYLNTNTNWNDYALVYLSDTLAKCIVTHDHQYHEINYLNW